MWKSNTSNPALLKHKCSDTTVDCDICDKSIRTLLLPRHKAMHTRLGEVGPRNVKFDKHMGFEELDAQIDQFMIKVDGVWTCKSCTKTATNNNCLYGHVEVNHMDLTIPCTNCGAKFKSREGLRKHLSMSCPATINCGWYLLPVLYQ